MSCVTKKSGSNAQKNIAYAPSDHQARGSSRKGIIFEGRSSDSLACLFWSLRPWFVTVILPEKLEFKLNSLRLEAEKSPNLMIEVYLEGLRPNFTSHSNTAATAGT